MMKPFLFFLFYISLIKASDTLSIVKSFDSPIANPRTLAFDGSHFWISSFNNSNIYKLDTNIQIVDSIPMDFDRITGIAFQKDEMWVINDKSTGRSSNFPMYRLYSIAPCDGSVLDSIEIMSSAANATDTNHLWGLAILHNVFYVSYNGGWGPCVYQISPQKSNSIDYLCCAHPAAMTTANNTIYSIGNNSPNGGGNNISHLKITADSITEVLQYSIGFTASDITYDGGNIWLCNNTDSKILKMEKAALGVYRKKFARNTIFAEHNPANSSVRFNFGNGNADFLKVVNISGAILHRAYNVKTGYVWQYERSAPNGIYLLNFAIEGAEYSDIIPVQK